MTTLIECYVLALSINYLNEFSQLSCDIRTLRDSILQMRKLRLRVVKASVQRVEARRELQVTQTVIPGH